MHHADPNSDSYMGNDQILLIFLTLLEQDILAGKNIIEADPDQLDRIGKLVDGVDTP